MNDGDWLRKHFRGKLQGCVALPAMGLVLLALALGLRAA